MRPCSFSSFLSRVFFSRFASFHVLVNLRIGFLPLERATELQIARRRIPARRDNASACKPQADSSPGQNGSRARAQERARERTRASSSLEFNSRERSRAFANIFPLPHPPPAPRRSGCHCAGIVPFCNASFCSRACTEHVCLTFDSEINRR